MATADKLRWITALHAAGLREIEVGSFVPAHLLPQMADDALNRDIGELARLLRLLSGIYDQAARLAASL